MSIDHPHRPLPLGRRRWLALAAAGLVLAGTLGACGSGEDSGGGTEGSEPQTGGGATPSTTAEDATTTAGDGGDAPAGGGDLAVEGVEVATVTSPIVLLPRPGDDGHLYLAERPGRIRRLAIEADGTLSSAGDVLDLTDQTTIEAERGLLGLAFSADGEVLYASHTDEDGNSRVAAYAMDGAVADPDSSEVLFAVDQPFANHNGGNIVLGPDGLLWLGLGDGGSGDDPDNRAQDPDDPLGKFLRIDPADGSSEIVISGVRNPWRFSFDTDGSLWIGDVGQGAWEEIDHLPAGEIEGANLGWSAKEGTHDNENVDPEGRTGEDPIDPVFEYSHDGGNCSVTGGFVYRGQDLPDLVGAYLFADYCVGSVRAITLGDDGTFATELDLGVEIGQIQSFGTDQDGEAYVLSDTGTILRLAPAA